MLRTYLRTSLRHLARARTHTVINVVGLSLGLLCALLLLQKVRYEQSFDASYPEADRIYRVYRDGAIRGDAFRGPGLPYPFFETFRQELPDVPTFSIVDRNFGAPVIAAHRLDGRVERFHTEDGVAFVDAAFFDLFPRRWVAGSAETAFAQPRSAVLSEGLAQTYFGTTNVLGRTLTFDNEVDLTVTGVVTDPPPNTSVRFDLLIGANLGEAHARDDGGWGSVSSTVQAFLKLPADLTVAEVERRMSALLEAHQPEQVGEVYGLRLQPLHDVHLNPELGPSDGQAPVSRELLWVLLLIAGVLLATACINYVNLSTVLVMRRAREAGIRKVLGASSAHLAAYFLAETAIVTFVALLLALLAAYPAGRALRPLLGDDVPLHPFTDPVLLSGMVGLALLVVLAAGLYPALLLARTRPAVTVRGAAHRSPRTGLRLRRGLVVAQFAISQALIICMLVAASQLRHLYDAPLGYDPTAVIEFAVPESDPVRLATLRSELLRSSRVSHATFSNTGASSGITWLTRLSYERDGAVHDEEAQIKLVDTAYVATYGMTLLAGERPRAVRPDSQTAFVINERFAQMMGFATPETALGASLDVWDWSGHVAAVVEDFNTNSLHEPIEPTVLVTTDRSLQQGAARIQATRLTPAVQDIRTAWTRTFPDYVFDYTFLDDRLAEFYEDEQRTESLVQVFAWIAIVIGCIGLFGLISYVAQRRAKELSVRKVLGATPAHLIALLSREFVVLVAAGFLLAAPVAYWAMEQWLSDFAYRVGQDPLLFLAALLIAMVLALVTIVARTLRAALANPADALRQS